MEWSEGIGRAIEYIESHITEELTIAKIAEQAFLSPYYFQKGFSLLCGFTVGEYVKKRRLTLAGGELISTDKKVIELALKYGYDSRDKKDSGHDRLCLLSFCITGKGGADKGKKTGRFCDHITELFCVPGYTTDRKKDKGGTQDEIEGQGRYHHRRKPRDRVCHRGQISQGGRRRHLDSELSGFRR